MTVAGQIWELRLGPTAKVIVLVLSGEERHVWSDGASYTGVKALTLDSDDESALPTGEVGFWNAQWFVEDYVDSARIA